MKESPKFDEERAKRFVRQANKSAQLATTKLARRITADWAPDTDSHAFLDVGTGAGRLLVAVKALFPGARVIGIDPLEYMVHAAQQNAETAGFTDIEVRHGTAEQIPLDSEAVDLVVAQSSLLFWEDPKKGLSEVHRVLRPDGKLVILDWNKSHPKWRYYLRNLSLLIRSGWVRAKDNRSSFRRAYRIEHVLRLVHESKFELVETEGKKELRFFVKAVKAK